MKKIEEQIQDYILHHTKAFPDDQQFTSEHEFVVFLADYFDCISGISGGSWAALYLASKGKGDAKELFKSREIIESYGTIVPGTARGLDVFFMEYGEKIYPPGFLNYIRGITRRTSGWFPFNLPGVNAPRHPVEGLVQALEDFLGNLTYSDVETSCLVNAFDLTSNGPILFVADHISKPSRVSVTYFRSKNDPRRQFPKENSTETEEQDWSREFLIGDMVVKPGMEFKLTDVGLASSAMPMYHPAHTAKPAKGPDEEFSFIDGGLVEGNPTLYSFNFVTSRSNTSLYDAAIVSLGTGGVAGDYITNMNRGAVAWTLSGDLIDIVVGGASEAKQAEVDYLFYSTFGMKPGQYLRINYFAEDLESEEATAFSTFNSPIQLNTYYDVGQTTADRYSKLISDFVQDFVFAPKEDTNEEFTTCRNF